LGVGLTSLPHKIIYETYKKGTQTPPRAVALMMTTTTTTTMMMMMMMMMMIAQKDLCLQP